MASASPMASQLKSSFTSPITTRPSLLSPKGLSTSPFWLFPSKRLSSFPIKAVQSDKQNFQVVQPINGFIGSLETPVTSSPLIAWYLSNLLAYRTAVSPLLRVIEITIAYILSLICVKQIKQKNKILQNIVEKLTGHQQNGNHGKINGTVVLMKKNVLDFNDLNASVLDGVYELVGQGVSLQLISAVHADDSSEFIFSVQDYTVSVHD
ncbi:hypothetical protein ACFX2I_033276 [Malus domestica]